MIGSASTPVLPILVAVAAAVVLTVLVAASLSLARTATELKELAEELSEHATSVLGNVERTVERAREELDRVDDLVGSAEAIAETVGSASRLAHVAVSGPLIKLMAFGAGTARAGRRLRGREAKPAPPKRTARLRKVG